MDRREFLKAGAILGAGAAAAVVFDADDEPYFLLLPHAPSNPARATAITVATEARANVDGQRVFNRNQLEAWLRDPPAQLPMAPDERRGMPNLHLSENDVDQLIAYLQTLGPYPQGVTSP